MKTIKLLFLTSLMFVCSTTTYAQGASFAPSKLVIRFDDAPQEITWELKNQNGTVFQTGGPFDSRFANKTISFEFTTAFGTSPLQLTIKDSAGNGLSGNGAWAINTESLSRIDTRPASQAVGLRIANGNRNFGSQTTLRFDPTTRTNNLGQLGNINYRDIFLVQVPSDGFYQIQGNRFVRININNIPDGNDDDDDDDDQPNAIQDVINLKVVNRFAKRLRVIIDSDISDRANLKLVDRNGNTVRNLNRNIKKGRNRINIGNLKRGRHFLTIKTNKTTGKIEKNVFVK